MHPPRWPLAVGVIDPHRDTAWMLELALGRFGYRAVPCDAARAAENPLYLSHFLDACDARALVLDMSPAGPACWQWFDQLEGAGACAGRAVVLTTTHHDLLRSARPPHCRIHPILQKPYHCGALARLIQWRLLAQAAWDVETAVGLATMTACMASRGREEGLRPVLGSPVG